jgi:hypothetical protein
MPLRLQSADRLFGSPRENVQMKPALMIARKQKWGIHKVLPLIALPMAAGA